MHFTERYYTGNLMGYLEFINSYAGTSTMTVSPTLNTSGDIVVQIDIDTHCHNPDAELYLMVKHSLLGEYLVCEENNPDDTQFYRYQVPISELDDDDWPIKYSAPVDFIDGSYWAWDMGTARLNPEVTSVLSAHWVHRKDKSGLTFEPHPDQTRFAGEDFTRLEFTRESNRASQVNTWTATVGDNAVTDSAVGDNAIDEITLEWDEMLRRFGPVIITNTKPR